MVVSSQKALQRGEALNLRLSLNRLFACKVKGIAERTSLKQASLRKLMIH